MKIDHLSFPEAVKKLADKAGVILEESLADDPEERDRVALVELMSRLAGTFHHLLLSSDEAAPARQMLEDRKIRPETVETFQLGWVPLDRYWLKTFLVKRKYNESFLKKSGLFSQNYPDSCLFSGRLLFPIRNLSAQVVAFGGRVVGKEEGPKYLNSPETLIFQKRRTLYALDRATPYIRKEQVVHLCEGYMDALALHQSGVCTAVAPLGTSFTEDHATLLRRYANNIVCLFDSDEAGRKAAAKAVEILLAHDVESRVVVVNNGKDPAEILEKKGESEVRSMVLESVRGFDFLLDFHYNLSSHASSFDWNGFSKNIFAILHKVGSQVRQEALMKSVASRLGVSESALIQDFRAGVITRPSPKKTVVAVSRSEEWIFLLTASANPQHFHNLRGDLSSDDFTEVRSKELFESLAKLDDEASGSFFSQDALFSASKGKSWEVDLVQGLSSGEFELQSELVLKDGLSRLKLRRLRTRLSEIQSSLKEKTLTFEENQRILTEVNFLNREIDRWKRIL
jgi:DNA primase